MNSLATAACDSFSRTLDRHGGGLIQIRRIRSPSSLINVFDKSHTPPCTSFKRSTVTMRDRSKNRKPLQRGRISVEAIQAVQALKRAKSDCNSLERAFESKFRRLVKADMIAVLRDLQRQNESLLAFQVFDDIRKEHWYKPKVLVYADMISVLASNNLFEKVEMLCLYLKMEKNLEGDTESFNALLRILMEFGFTRLAIECFHLMKAIGCDPDESTYRFLINGLESNGETGLSSTLKQEAEEHFGWPLELQEEEELVTLRRIY
ncbi:hypothetical protein Scep_000053 [Stephania cephalantha]|uniref:Pentatricopeptide repeat-containing protein n=1 Tax=Stephania cephalantha TaxID=152367 RepID=A0AAP0L5C0_9MAGN